MGVIAFKYFSFAVNIEFGVVVFSLAFVCDEVVKAGAFFVVIFAHMPFADVGGFVTFGVKASGEVWEVGREFGEVIHYFMRVGVEAAED